MTPGALVRARDGSGMASTAATALWGAITERVGEDYAGAALDMIGQHVGGDTDVPDAVLREAVVRLGLYFDHTEILLGRATLKTDDTELAPLSEYHGSAFRKSGVMGLLGPWATPVAGVI